MHLAVRLGQSVQGRPIEMAEFPGDGPGVLILGGIHGNEPTSSVLARRLSETLTADPSLTAGHAVAIIAEANPDGLAATTRANANHVDLNRNFPAANFKSGGHPLNRRGSAAASEPETKAILAAIERVRPRLIISIHAITDGKQCNNYDGPGEEIAKSMSSRNGYPAAETIGYPTPGSLGAYSGIDRKIPTITLELPLHLPGDKAWEQNRDALLAAIAAAR